MAIYGDNKHNVEMEHVDTTATFTVKLEFTDIDAKNPLEAVKKVLRWIENHDGLGGADTFCYDVTNEETKEEFIVDMSQEDDEDKTKNTIYGRKGKIVLSNFR